MLPQQQQRHETSVCSSATSTVSDAIDADAAAELKALKRRIAAAATIQVTKPLMSSAAQQQPLQSSPVKIAKSGAPSASTAQQPLPPTEVLGGGGENAAFFDTAADVLGQIQRLENRLAVIRRNNDQIFATEEEKDGMRQQQQEGEVSHATTIAASPPAVKKGGTNSTNYFHPSFYCMPSTKHRGGGGGRQQAQQQRPATERKRLNNYQQPIVQPHYAAPLRNKAVAANRSRAAVHAQPSAVTARLNAVAAQAKLVKSTQQQAQQALMKQVEVVAALERAVGKLKGELAGSNITPQSCATRQFAYHPKE